MKILCVCQGGNVRSVALAYWLKSRGHDAIACGLDHARPNTLLILCAWADVILPVSEPVRQGLIAAQPLCEPRVRLIPIGEDR